jgi:hypothetical protein
MIIALPFLVALIGLVVYMVATNPKAAELGRIAFWVGLLVGLLRVGGAAVSVLPRP